MALMLTLALRKALPDALLERRGELVRLSQRERLGEALGEGLAAGEREVLAEARSALVLAPLVREAQDEGKALTLWAAGREAKAETLALRSLLPVALVLNGSLLEILALALALALLLCETVPVRRVLAVGCRPLLLPLRVVS